MADAVKLVCATCGQANRVPVARLMDAPKCGSCGDPLVTGKVAELDVATHDRMVKGDDLPVVVDYWAPWCGPCRMMAPEFARAAGMLEPEMRLVKLNSEAEPQVAATLGIRGIPTLLLYRGGREVARQSGAMDAASIAGWARAQLRD